MEEQNKAVNDYRCDDFVVNDTKLGLVQKVREHLQNLENYQYCERDNSEEHFEA
ncbi:hypothetical protein P7K49_017018 [Saguinus oedipus]|uniref:Uncharacterized protein n=1 Tax=Saguinus oedipus TaxID=9490 RepID=A0ABQ9V3Z8_SAGOE|nr:hypothetical protein P7K49_017018 [Saguinus oedipus]